jgi:CHAD domain-containing protein
MAPARASDPAGEVFADVVADHVRRIQQRVPAAITDSPDGVHRLRAAVRRLRTVLAVYRPVFDRAEADALRDRLAVLGDVLGDARDLEVRREDVESLGASARVALDARERLVAELDTLHAEAHRRFLDWSDGPDWEELTAELVRWTADPPLGTAAEKSARKVAHKRLRKAVAKALRAAEDVDLDRLDATGSRPASPADEAAGDGAGKAADDGTVDLDDALAAAHRLRKAGRRLTHAARAVTRKPTKVLGASARNLAGVGKQLQSSLGDHRDALLLVRWVNEVADVVEREGGDRAPYDRLAGAAARRASAAVEDARAAVESLRAAAG